MGLIPQARIPKNMLERSTNATRMSIEAAEKKRSEDIFKVHLVLSMAIDNILNANSDLTKEKSLYKREVKKRANRLMCALREYNRDFCVTTSESDIELVDEISDEFKRLTSANEMYIKVAIDNFLLKNNIKHNNILSKLHVATAASQMACTIISRNKELLSASLYYADFDIYDKFSVNAKKYCVELISEINKANGERNELLNSSYIEGIPNLREAIIAYMGKLLCDSNIYKQLNSIAESKN